jgi:hypothetical protein
MFELDVETKLIIGSIDTHGPWPPSKASSTLSYLLSNSSEFLSPKI